MKGQKGIKTEKKPGTKQLKTGQNREKTESKKIIEEKREKPARNRENSSERNPYLGRPKWRLASAKAAPFDACGRQIGFA